MAKRDPRLPNEDDEEIPPSKNFDELMNAFMETFAPASSAKEATQRLTTREIFNTMQDHYDGADLTLSNIYSALLNEGYKMKVDSDTKFCWLLKEK